MFVPNKSLMCLCMCLYVYINWNYQTCIYERTQSNACLETNNPLQYDTSSQNISSKRRREVKSHRARVNVAVILDIVRPSVHQSVSLSSVLHVFFKGRSQNYEKATISLVMSFRLSVCLFPSVRETSAHTRPIFVIFCISGFFFEKSFRKIQVCILLLTE